MMTASTDHEDEGMDAATTPEHDLPPDSIQEAISNHWLSTLTNAKPVPVSLATSSGFETGIFLQQLTNSVNRALHKQHCTCNGKTYTAEELRTISNPAMFAPVPTSPGRPDQATLTLPPIDNDNAAKNTASDLLAASNSPLKAYLERENGKKLGTISKRGTQGTKLLGGALAMEKEKEELKLPNIMEIMDINGNNWKIVQDVSRQRQPRIARYDTKLFDRQSVSMQECQSPPKTPSGNSKVGPLAEGSSKHGSGARTSDAAIDAVTRSNSPRELAGLNPDASDENAPQQSYAMASSVESFTQADENPKDSVGHLPELAPTCTLVQINQSPRLNADSVQTNYDEAERRALLLKLNSAVRTGKIPYTEFLKRVSKLAPSFKLDRYRDKRARTSSMEQAIPDRSKRQDTRHLSEQPMTWTREANIANPDAGTKANTLASSSYTGIYAKDPHAMFPPELQKLYARGGLKVTTLKIDVGDSLPSNFLTQDKEELQVMYPMYGFRVEQERESVISRMNSLQSKGEKLQTDSRRQHKPAMPNDMRMLLFPPHANLVTDDPDDFKLKFKVRKDADRRSQEGRIYCLHGRQSISRDGEILDLPAVSYVRRISGSESRDGMSPSRSFPKQPPTTPADDRRQSQDSRSEMIARSIPNTIPENHEDENQEADKTLHRENSTSRSLGRIQEDPLDAVSHANTYGTEMHPKRLLDTFEESLDKEEAKMIKEYVHIVVPTNRKMSGKGKRVSWQTDTDGDNTTDFTKSRETLQSIQTNEKPPTPDRLQMALTISDVSDGHNSGRGDELKPAVKVLEIDNCSVGTFESLSRRPMYHETFTGAHGTQVFHGGSDFRKESPAAVSTKKVVFVSPVHEQKEK